MDPLDQARWFAQEVRPLEPALRTFLHARFRNLTEVDDLVQESYVRVLRARATNGVTNVKSFLFSTARNLALDWLRRGNVIRFEPIEHPSQRTVSDPGSNAADQFARQEELNLLRAAIATLPTRCREVLIRRKLHGLSREEIARQMEISTHTVNAQIALGMLRCRRYFQEHGLITGENHEDEPTTL
jgi:RNA polymerase sigma-70 factor (ECF subfamily)